MLKLILEDFMISLMTKYNMIEKNIEVDKNFIKETLYN